MDEARASWNTVFQSKEGFECQITLRDEDEIRLSRRVDDTLDYIVRKGGVPLRRRYYQAPENKNSEEENEEVANPEKEGKTYVDENGIRRCNRKLSDGKLCGYPVTKKGGRYGAFWSCPNYKEHAA